MGGCFRIADAAAWWLRAAVSSRCSVIRQGGDLGDGVMPGASRGQTLPTSGCGGIRGVRRALPPWCRCQGRARRLLGDLCSGPTLVVLTRRPGAASGLALGSSIASASWPVLTPGELIAGHSPAQLPSPPAACSARSESYMRCGLLGARGHSATRIVWPRWSGADRPRRSLHPRPRGRWCSCSVRR